MIRIVAVAAAALGLSLAACAAEPIDSTAGEEGRIGTEREAVTSTNGLATNALATNALATNSLAMNALATNALATNALATNALATNALNSTALDPNGSGQTQGALARMLLKYVYSCAMPAGMSMTVPGGTPSVFTGDLGLAPQWATGPCDGSCQRWVSACVLSRVNTLGERQLVSIRKPAGYGNPNALVVSATEKAQFPYREAAFYGNLWAKTATGKAPMYQCIDLALLRVRDSGGVPNVGYCDAFTWAGSNAPQYQTQTTQACAVDSGGTYRGCTNYDVSDHIPATYGSDGTYGPYDEVITIYRADPKVLASHYDYVAGTAIPAQTSPCAYKVGSLDSYCVTSGWDSRCVSEAKAWCGNDGSATGHDVCTAGTAMTRNDSDCINSVVYGPATTADPYCADHAWDAQCVAEAKARCGTICP